VPEPHREWVRNQAVTLRDQLVAGEYPVHGDPDLLVPDEWGSDRAGPTDEEVLDVALRALLGVKEAGG
jgi:hypothetical protein